MTELAGHTVREYRELYDSVESQQIGELLERTRGYWTEGDGMRYQDALRDTWERCE